MDDFRFAVTSASAGPVSGGDQTYTVNLRVRNQAKRVDFTFKPAEIAVSAPSSNPMELISSSCWGSDTLHAGEEREFVLTYKGGPGAKKLEVRLTGGGPLGIALESLFFGKKVIEVDIGR